MILPHRLGLAAVALALAAGMWGGSRAAAQVVVSQVSGNGGLGSDPYDRDFIELFNRGSTPVDLTGWSVQVFGDSGSLATPGTPSWDVTPLYGTILPGQYFLVMSSLQRGSQGASVATAVLPPADVVGVAYAQASLVTNNAVALMSSLTPIPEGQCPGGPALVDLFRVGFASASCFEGSAPGGPALSGTAIAGAFRNDGGCADTNDSAADITGGQVPSPRNSDTNAFAQGTFSPGTLVSGTGGAVTLTIVRVNSSCNPLPGALTAATANLSALGLSSAEPLFDDGAHGDGGAGDGTFGVQFAVSAAQGAGAYVVPINATSGATTLGVSARLRVLPPAASNDVCGNAIDLSSPSGINILTNGPYSTSVNISSATGDGIDAGTCNADTEIKFSVWYTFTPAVSGALRITESSSEDVVSSLYAACGAASSICLQREDGAFPVAAGTSYWIQIGRETGAGSTPEVPLQLTFAFVAPPSNDLPCSADIISTFPFSAQPYAPSASNETDPLVNPSCDATANPAARNGVWYSFTAPSDGALEIQEFEPLNSTNFTLCSGPCSAPTPITCVDETTSGALITGLAGGTTYLLLVSYDPAVTTSSPSQPYNFTINFLAAPSNDTCSGAKDLNATGLPFSEVVHARAATVDAGVPTSTGTSSVFNSCNTTLGNRPNGVWYTYTTGPTQSGSLRVLESSSNDVFIDVFNSCGGSAVQCTNGSFTTDEFYVGLAPSTTYYILIGMESTTGSPSGDYALSFAYFPTPSNDLACGATYVNSPTFHDDPIGPGATADVDTSCNYNIPAQSTTGYGVWYRFLTASPKQLTVHQNNTDVLVYGLFTGTDCNALSEIDCLQGSNGALTTDNTAYFNLQAGTEYWLLIGKIANSQPFRAYNLDFTLADPKGACCTANGVCVIATQATCVGTWKGAFTYCGETPNYEDTAAAAIPDHVGTNPGTPGVLTKTISVPDSGVVSDLKVLVNINHLRVGDLIFTLSAPGGASAELMRRIDDDDDLACPNNNSQGRLTDLGGAYIFDDQAYTPFGPGIHAAAKYFDSSNLFLRPNHYKASSCSVLVYDFSGPFVGTDMNGVWTLTVEDRQAGTVGTLNSWGLIINGGSNAPCRCRADIDGGGVSVQDIFAFLNAWFAGCVGQPGAPCNGVSADFNGNGLSVQDIFDFLNSWFAGC